MYAKRICGWSRGRISSPSGHKNCKLISLFFNEIGNYYDPTGQTYSRTASAKRDPILFGLINHSERLYYIADWEDELCDLTLDRIAERANIIQKL